MAKKYTNIKFDKPFVLGKTFKKREFVYDFRVNVKAFYIHNGITYQLHKYPIGFDYANIKLKKRVCYTFLGIEIRYGWELIDDEVLPDELCMSSSKKPPIEYFDRLFKQCIKKYKLD